MGLRSDAKRTLENLSSSARTVGGAAEMQTVALVAVTVVSVVALALAVVALISQGDYES